MSDERPLIFRRELFGLTATDDASEAALQSVKHGECVELKMKRPRNLQHHRKFFSMLQLIFNNQERYATLDHLLTAFKFAIKHTEIIRTKRGDIEVPKSISFASMSQDEFNEFYQRAVDFVLAEVVPMTVADLERELMEYAA